MSLYFAQEYKKKLLFADEVVKIIKSGDWIQFGGTLACINELDFALAMRKDELRDVKISYDSEGFCCKSLEKDPGGEHFCRRDWDLYRQDRRGFNIVGSSPALAADEVSVNSPRLIYMATVSPMDKDGYFSLGPKNHGYREMLEMADCVILEINENIPWREERWGCIRISQVDYVVVGNNSPLLVTSEDCIRQNDRYHIGRLDKSNPGTLATIKAM